MTTYRQTWDLDVLFEGGSQSPALLRAIDTIEQSLAELRRLTAALPDPGAPGGIDRWAVLLAYRDRTARRNYQVWDFVQCLESQNVHDEGARTLHDRLVPLGAAFEAERQHLYERIRTASDDGWEQLLADRRIRPLAFVLRQVRLDQADQLPQEQQELADGLRPHGLDAWYRLYCTVTGKATVKVGPEQLSLGQATAALADPDQNRREALWQGLTESLAGQADVCAAALNHMTGFRLELYRRRGFDSVLTEALRANRLQPATLEAMWSAAESALPTLIAYLHRKARLLGQPGLHWADLQAPVGAAAQPVPYDEAADLIISQLGAFSPRMGDYASRAFREGWVEAENRPGKRPGGYHTVFPESEQSRIFLTYSGAGHMGPAALAHELGHGFHFDVMRGLPVWMREAPLPLAETASTFAELVLARALIRRAPAPAQKLALLDERCRAAVGYLLDIRSRFLFEQRLHEARRHGLLSVAHLNGLMEEAQREAFGGAMTGYCPLYWVQRQHFYFPTPFYNFPYTFGYLFSAGIWVRAAEAGPGFEQAYVALLRDTGRMAPEDLAWHHLGADLTRPAFWQEAVRQVLADVTEFLALTD
jgi:oligoendopeptidase F